MPSAPLVENETPKNQSSRTVGAPPDYPGNAYDSPPPRGSGFRKAIVLAILALVVGGAVWRIVSNRRSETQQAAKATRMNANRPVPVSVAMVQQRSMPIYLTGLGSVTAFYTDTIKSRVDGQLMSVNFREGQDVKTGDLLAVIDPRPYQAALEQAQGQLARDQASLKNARAEADRYAALYKAGVVSKETLDLQLSNNGQFEGAIQQDQAAIDAAKVNLAYTRITSPIDGRIGLRLVDPGNIVHATDTTGLLVITQLHPITVIFTLPEDQLPQVVQLLRQGRTLTVLAYDRSDTHLLDTGKLLTMDNQIDPTTGTDKLKAVFPNPNEVLFPNQFVNARLVVQQRDNAIVVPVAALQHGSQGDFVYLVDPDTNTVSVQTIKVAMTEGQDLLVDSGLSAGQQVVIDGQEKLRPGSKVVPHIAQAEPASSTADSLQSPAHALRGSVEPRTAQSVGSQGIRPGSVAGSGLRSTRNGGALQPGGSHAGGSRGTRR
ncbi:MAG: MdtA/MuxA family multidrug efflux RND transporter periplasmic adaptor subunit [Acidobacteriaceae bacterium]